MNWVGKLRDEQGTAVVILAISLTLLMALVAIVVDVGKIYVTRAEIQSAVDLAALAGAQQLPNAAGAAQVTLEYAAKNGLTPSDLEITFTDENRSIQVTGTRNITFTFARLIGMTNLDVPASATAASVNIGGAFEYALYSGSTTATLSVNGSSQYIRGHAHSNQKLNFNGSNLTVTGRAEAVDTLTINGSDINVGEQISNAPFVPMPDFADTIREQAEAGGQSYIGNKTFNSSDIRMDSPIYVEGNLNVNGSKFVGTGTIVATGSITFNGSNLTNSGTDALCFYSRSGNITVNGSNATIYGILYAPGGTITLNGSNQTVYGRVIGDQVNSNGSNLQILSSANDLNSLPTKGTKLTR